MDKRIETDELIFQGRIAEVHKVQLRMPGGELVPRDLIKYPGAAVILPVLDDGSIVLIRNDRFAVNEQLLELPAGTLERGEEPLACAARELTEETGYTAARLERLGSFFAAPGSSDERMHSFLARGLTAGPQALEKHEQISVEIHTEDEVRRMIADETLHDGKTLATLALYWIRKGRGK